jgi:hypothetical protein
MRWYRVQAETSFKFKKIVAQTKKAILFEIEPGIKIWVPRSWIKKQNRSSFKVGDHIASEVRLKIRAEKQADNK